MSARPATRLDEPAAVAAWTSAEAALGRSPSKARQAKLRAALRDPLSLGLVVGDPVVGVLLAEPWRDGDGRPAAGVLHLSLLHVAASSQRQGHATALLDALLARYPRVRVSSGEADGFFTSRGFAPTDGGTLESPALQGPAT